MYVTSPSGPVTHDRTFAERRVGVREGGRRLGFGHARQVHLADADTGQDAPHVLLVVGVQGADPEGHRGDQADQERDAEPQGRRRLAPRRRRLGASTTTGIGSSVGAASTSHGDLGHGDDLGRNRVHLGWSGTVV